MIKLGFVYILAGLVFAAYALLSARDQTNPRRWRNALFGACWPPASWPGTISVIWAMACWFWSWR